MKYAALLRGINVGGKSMIKMTDLKICFQKAGFSNVLTYINSGNVIFETNEEDAAELNELIEEMLTKTFGMPLRVVIVSQTNLKKIVSDIAPEWDTNQHIRKYIAFVRAPVTSIDVINEISVKKGIDSVKKGKGVVYMSTLLKGLTKSGINRLAAKKIYKDITIRNYNTTVKILSLMEK